MSANMVYDHEETSADERVYSVAEAVEYLNVCYPKVAPKSEETIRRAIRTKQLKAVMNLGREGHQILERDLQAFGESRYGKKLRKTGTIAADVLRQALTPVFSGQTDIPDGKEPGKFSAFLKQHMSGELDEAHYKLRLYEEKEKWEEKRQALLCQRQMLENELERCNSEIQAFASEIGQLHTPRH